MTTRTCRRCRRDFQPSRDFHNFCWECYSSTRDSKHEETHAHSVPFDAVELRWLIQLTHPDRHENSPRANHVTAKLLEMRGAGK